MITDSGEPRDVHVKQSNIFHQPETLFGRSSLYPDVAESSNRFQQLLREHLIRQNTFIILANTTVAFGVAPLTFQLRPNRINTKQRKPIRKGLTLMPANIERTPAAIKQIPPNMEGISRHGYIPTAIATQPLIQ